MEAYLGMGEDERDLMNELDIWKVLSSPRDMLYLSHAQANQAGEPLRAAPAIAAIRRIFPGLTVLGTVEGAQGALHPLAPQPTLDAIGHASARRGPARRMAASLPLVMAAI